MYKLAKPCVSLNNTLTDNFSCIIGVRQGYKLLFADDAVLLVESQEDLHQSIIIILRYCSMCKMNINVSKLKLLSSLLVKEEKYLQYFGENELEVVGQYKYLASYLTMMENSRRQKKNLVTVKGNRAMFLLLRKCRHVAPAICRFN